MTITYHAGNILRGTTADRTGGTWTNLPIGWIFIESNGLAIYWWTGSVWSIVGSAGGTLAVSGGGTGATTLTGVLKGNGTSAVTAAAQLAVADGGTGAATLTGILKGNGTSAVTASNTLTSITLTAPVIDRVTYGDVGIDFSNSPYTILATKTIIRVDPSAGSPTANTILTLPTAVGIAGVKYTIKRTDITASSFLAQINTTSSQTIDGAAAFYLWPAEFVEVESDGANWFVTNSNDPTGPLYYMFRGSRRYVAANQGIYMTLGTSTTSPAINTLWALPFVVPKTTKFDVITFNVTTLASPSNARAGIYRDTGNGYPGALIFDTGSISCATTGAKDTTITAGLQVIPRGLYWLSWECDTASPLQINILGTTGTMYAFQGYSSNSTIARYGYSVAHTFGALPDPYTVGATILTTAPGVSNPVPAIMLQPV